MPGHLRPSRELLEYYRQKIAEYDGEYEKLVHKLEKYKCTYENVVCTQIQIVIASDDDSYFLPPVEVTNN